jgi:hypothetical protein
VQRPLDIGQRHVDDCDVEQQHEDARAHRGERPPLVVHTAPIVSLIPALKAS